MELAAYRRNVFSQYGEDGIIEEIFNRLNITSGYVCEFGAWDGKHLSNTYNLYCNNSNFIPILIESDKEKFESLEQNLFNLNKKYIIRKFLNKEDNHNDSLSNILKNFNIKDLDNNNFKLLSIDVDGPDYEIWKNFTDYSPSVVIIEASKLVNPEEQIYPTEDGGASASIIIELAKEKNYELVCHTGSNCIFVKKELFSKINIKDNSLTNLYIYSQSSAIRRMVKNGIFSNEEGENRINAMSSRGEVIEYAETFSPLVYFPGRF